MDTTVKRYSMCIDGEFVDAPSTISVVNPATEKIISEVPQATQEHINTAVLAAQKAQPAWAKLPAIKRASYLTRSPPQSGQSATTSQKSSPKNRARSYASLSSK